VNSAAPENNQFLFHVWNPACYSCYKPGDKPHMVSGPDCYFIWDMSWMIFGKCYSLIGRSKKASYLKIHKLSITLTQSDCSSFYIQIVNKVVIQWARYCVLKQSQQYHLLCIIYRILCILFLGLTLSRDISGSPFRLTWYTTW
jgi:hypothetical protein